MGLIDDYRFLVSSRFLLGFVCCLAVLVTVGRIGFLECGGFAFEVQLSLTEKGQYAVAYDLSCKKDCHELHATDP
ncbi:hypothetical protein, partial [Neisseria meningitidis]